MGGSPLNKYKLTRGEKRRHATSQRLKLTQEEGLEYNTHGVDLLLFGLVSFFGKIKRIILKRIIIISFLYYLII